MNKYKIAQKLNQQSFELFKKKSMLAYREWYVARTNRIDQGMYLAPIRSPRYGIYLAPVKASFLFFGLRGVQISTK